MSNTISDIRRIQLEGLTGLSNRSIDDMEFIYYSSVSGLTPIARYSLADHQRAYWKAQTGFDVGKTNIDLETIFLNSKGVAAGSIDDRRNSYYSGPSVIPIASKMIIDARLFAGVDGDVVSAIPNQVAGSPFASFTQATGNKKPLFRSANPNLLRYNQATAAIDVNTNDVINTTNCTIARVALALAYSGFCVQGSSIALGDIQFGQSAGAVGDTPIVAGNTYSVFASIGSVAISRSCFIRVNYYTATHTFLSTANTTTTASGIGTLTNLVFQVVAPATAAFMRVNVVFSATAAAAEVHYYANLGIMNGTVAVWLPPVSLANNQPVFQFDGVNDALITADWFGSMFWPMSMYLVCYTNDVSRTQRHFFFRTGDGVFLETSAGNITNNAFIGGVGRPSSAAAAINNVPVIISGTHDDSGTIVRVNGTPAAKTVTPAGQPVWVANTIMVVGGQGTNWTSGGIAYLAIYQGLHTLAQSLAIEQALGASFGIVVP